MTVTVHLLRVHLGWSFSFPFLFYSLVKFAFIQYTFFPHKDLFLNFCILIQGPFFILFLIFYLPTLFSAIFSLAYSCPFFTLSPPSLSFLPSPGLHFSLSLFALRQFFISFSFTYCMYMISIFSRLIPKAREAHLFGIFRLLLSEHILHDHRPRRIRA